MNNGKNLRYPRLKSTRLKMRSLSLVSQSIYTLYFSLLWSLWCLPDSVSSQFYQGEPREWAFVCTWIRRLKRKQLSEVPVGDNRGNQCHRVIKLCSGPACSSANPSWLCILFCYENSCLLLLFSDFVKLQR